MRSSRWAWGVAALALLPVLGLFTTTRIFYVRDLSFFFWSRHLWLRHTLFAGQAPWWDPYVAGGQSAIADALNQIAMPITLVIRLLPSDVVSFNLWVALPLPIAAAGTFLFLRRRFTVDAVDPRTADAAAAFGAIVFAFSGPVVSMLNTPNLAWSVALMPWVLAACEVGGRRSEVGWVRVAVAYGLQALCGEPVTWVATGVLAAALAVASFRLKAETTGESPVASAFRRNALRLVITLVGLALGALLAAVQLVPTAIASVRAHRGALATPDFWSLHPLSLWEVVAPHLFGNHSDTFLADLPWMGALNFGRDPFFYSLYVGPLVLVFAAAGAVRLRRNGFWVAVALAFTIAALGGYTPLYPWLRTLVPPLMYFRFPVKYIVFAMFAVAVLSAEGWRARAGSVWLPAAAGIATVLATLGLLAMPGVLSGAAHALAVATHVKAPEDAAAFLVRTAPPLALRGGGMLLAAALLTAFARRRPYAWWLLAAVAGADLLATNGGLNPTLDLAKLSPPSWFTAASGPERLYIGGRVRGYMNPADPDAVSTWQIPAEATATEGRMELNAQLPMAPSGWRVRETLSYDLPYLWPAEYEIAVKRFERATTEERDAFLRRTGVRWCVVPAAQPRPWRAIADVSDWNMRVYECHPGATRVAVVPDAGDLEALFDPARQDDQGLGEARLGEDGPTRVSVEATLARPGMLVLHDSYDPSWQAEIDGRPAPIVRADTLYRGVALPSGHHVIRFTYRPRDFLIGLTVSGATALFLVLAGWYTWRTSAVSRLSS